MNEIQINIRSAQAINLAHEDFKGREIEDKKVKAYFMQRALFYYEVLGEFSKSVIDLERRQEENKKIPEDTINTQSSTRIDLSSIKLNVGGLK